MDCKCGILEKGNTRWLLPSIIKLMLVEDFGREVLSGREPHKFPAFLYIQNFKSYSEPLSKAAELYRTAERQEPEQTVWKGIIGITCFFFWTFWRSRTDRPMTAIRLVNGYFHSCGCYLKCRLLSSLIEQALDLNYQICSCGEAMSNGKFSNSHWKVFSLKTILAHSLPRFLSVHVM